MLTLSKSVFSVGIYRGAPQVKPIQQKTPTCKGEGGDKGMISFSCKNLGMDCSFEATGATERELMKSFIEHAEPAHDMKVLSADTIYKVQKAIKK